MVAAVGFAWSTAAERDAIRAPSAGAPVVAEASRALNRDENVLYWVRRINEPGDGTNPTRAWGSRHGMSSPPGTGLTLASKA